MGKRILVVDQRTPTPDQDSGSASTLSYLQILVEAGHEVVFVPRVKVPGRYTKALRDLGMQVPKMPAGPQPERARALVRRMAPECDLAILYRAPVAGQFFDLIRQVSPRTRIIFHAVDLHHLRAGRQLVLQGGSGHSEVEELKSLELDLAVRADATIVVSTHEQEVLRSEVPDAAVHHIPILRAAPRRSLTSRLHWRTRHTAQRLGPVGRALNRSDPRLRRRTDLVFVGGFEHKPNVDAVHWFVREVLPKVRERGVTNRFVIAGSRTPDDVAALESEDVIVLGYVRDLTQLFASARVSVAPLRYGAGLKGKVVSSLSLGLPTVATSIAAEGAGLTLGHDILVGDDPESMAAQIARVCRDDDLWQELSYNGYQTFCRQFSHTAGRDRVLDLVESLVGA